VKIGGSQSNHFQVNNTSAESITQASNNVQLLMDLTR